MGRQEREVPQAQIVELYRDVIAQRYPDQLSAWSVLSGYNFKTGSLCISMPILAAKCWSEYR